MSPSSSTAVSLMTPKRFIPCRGLSSRAASCAKDMPSSRHNCHPGLLTTKHILPLGPECLDNTSDTLVSVSFVTCLSSMFSAMSIAFFSASVVDGDNTMFLEKSLVLDILRDGPVAKVDNTLELRSVSVSNFMYLATIALLLLRIFELF